MSISDLARHNTDRIVFESYPERGFNYRMTDMQAALGLCQLEILDEVLERRRILCERYNDALAAIPGIETPTDPPYASRTWQSYCIRVRPQSAVSRTELMQRLMDDGIGTRKGIMAIHEEAAYAGAYDLAHTEAASHEMLMLPLFPDLSLEQQDYVIARVAHHVSVAALAA
jgi:dTDP-4-amino-4,6-dideoxygalactose transaminase